MTLLTVLGVASMVFVVVFTWRAAVAAQGVGQSPRSAIIEAWLNIAIGFAVNYSANLVLIPLAAEGGHLSAANAFWMGWLYTVISIVRQYVIRRWFNARLHSVAERLGSTT